MLSTISFCFTCPGIGDVLIAVSNEDFQTAERLGQEFADDLRLMLDGIGFGPGSGEAVELDIPPDVLGRVVPRLRAAASHERAAAAEERTVVEASIRRSELVLEVCDCIAAKLTE